jgi:hypothetical protein
VAERSTAAQSPASPRAGNRVVSPAVMPGPLTPTSPRTAARGDGGAPPSDRPATSARPLAVVTSGENFHPPARDGRGGADGIPKDTLYPLRTDEASVGAARTALSPGRVRRQPTINKFMEPGRYHRAPSVPLSKPVVSACCSAPHRSDAWCLLGECVAHGERARE